MTQYKGNNKGRTLCWWRE